MQKNSPAKLLLDSIATDSNFLFETLDQQNGNCKKIIFAKKVIKTFYSLEALDEFIEKNVGNLLNEHSGFAGYIGFEGDMELTLYEEIEIQENPILEEKEWGLNKIFAVKKPAADLYIEAVKKCQEYIKEGDIYQANISHKFLVETAELINKELALNIYKKLRTMNPAPYAGFMELNKYFLISSSPESFIKLQKIDDENLKITSSPIKGTAALNEKELLNISEKEKAEHIMIVDLIRNDLGRICKTNSVKAEKLLEIYKFKNLYHLISEISGITKNKSFAEIFLPLLPGGSISGAPKIRALDIIKELESSPRGPYTGIMGYYKFNQGGEFNILIRTIVIDKENNEISFHSGSGITTSSDPVKELEETYLKAENLIKTFE